MEKVIEIKQRVLKYFHGEYKTALPSIGEYIVKVEGDDVFVNGENWNAIPCETQSLVFNLIASDVYAIVYKRGRLVAECTCFEKSVEISCPIWDGINAVLERCGHKRLSPSSSLEEIAENFHSTPWRFHDALWCKNNINDRCPNCDCNLAPYVFDKAGGAPDGLVICSYRQSEGEKSGLEYLENELKNARNENKA